MRLIDADALRYPKGYEHLLKPIIMIAPTIEPNRIKCSHCEHYIRHDHRCGWWNHGVSNVDWCSYAKMKGGTE